MAAKRKKTLTHHNPRAVAPPTVIYSLGVEVPAGARLLVTSGQIGCRKDGTIPKDMASQVECALKNILALLKAAKMKPKNLVKVTVFLRHIEDAKTFRRVRDRILGTHAPAETMIAVAGLGIPGMLVETEAIAAAV